MRHSTYRLDKLAAPPIPFPMPGPQRGACLRILIAEARAADVPPAMLVTHLPRGEDSKFTSVRCAVVRRIFAEVPGVNMQMLARAFRRDDKVIKDFLTKSAATDASGKTL